jgi:hypothetical protein
MNNRAARRRAEKLAKKQAKISPVTIQQIVERHWQDAWHFNDVGLRVVCPITRRVKTLYPGV